MPNSTPQLRGWKEIAAHLGVSERTAKRWEGTHGLPVHRLPGRSRDTVVASGDELCAWRQGDGASLAEPVEQGDAHSRQLSPDTGTAAPAQATVPRRAFGAGLIVLAAVPLTVVLVAASAWLGAPGAGTHPTAAAQPRSSQGASERAPAGTERLLRVRRVGGSISDIGTRDDICGGFEAGPGHWVQLCTQPQGSLLRVDIRVYPFRGPEPKPAAEPATNIILAPDSEVLVKEPARFYVEWVTAPAAADAGGRAESRVKPNGSSR